MSLLALVVALFVFISIVNVLENNNKNNRHKIYTDAYLIQDTNFYSNYSKYTNFEINSVAGLQVLNTFCYKTAYPWTGKTITITADIDCGGASLAFGPSYLGGNYGGTTVTPYFNGTFDGNGYTISNFVISSATNGLVSYNITGAGGGSGASVYSAGLFQRLGPNAVIKNLRLNNFNTSINNLTAGSSSGSARNDFVVAGLVGYAENGAKIQNCSIENFNHVSKNSASSSNGSVYAYRGYVNGLSGIIAAGYGEISNCYVGNVTSSYTGSDMPITGVGPSVTKVTAVANSFTTFNASISQCISKGQAISVLSTTNSYNSSNQTSGLSCGSIGGESGTTWYYGGSQYNGGYPYLRQFIPGWQDVCFYADPDGGGTVSPSSIKVPKDIDFNTQYLVGNNTTNSLTLVMLNQQITATANFGFEFSEWYSRFPNIFAKFRLKTYTLTFTNADGVVGEDIISPTGTGDFTDNGNGSISYNVYHGTEITVTPASAEEKSGPFDLVYSFTDSSDTECNVTYTITDKYILKEDDNPVTATDETTITPEVEIKKIKPDFVPDGDDDGDGGVDPPDGGPPGGVDYGTEVCWDISKEEAKFTIDGSTYIYKAKSGYEIEYVEINGANYYPNDERCIILTGDLNVIIHSIALFEVTFKNAIDENGETGKATLSAPTNPIIIRNGSSLTATYSGYTEGGTSTITYEYNGTIVATYTLDQYYFMEDDCDEIWDLTNIDNDEEVTPIIKFYACKVTMTKTDNLNIADMASEDNYETKNDGVVFVVEFGTIVTFTFTQSNGIFTYTYTFTLEGNKIAEVKYTMKNNQYAMQYVLKADGERESIINGLNGEDSYTFEGPEDIASPKGGMISKTITPEFGKKQYAGELA